MPGPMLEAELRRPSIEEFGRLPPPLPTVPVPPTSAAALPGKCPVDDHAFSGGCGICGGCGIPCGDRVGNFPATR